MARSREYEAYIEDALSPLGDVRVKRMFGGAGVFRDGVMFALISDEQLYFKADEALAAELAAEGSEQFWYESKRGRIAMSYWLAPDRLFDEPDELVAMARRVSDGVAARRARRKPAKRRRAPA